MISTPELMGLSTIEFAPRVTVKRAVVTALSPFDQTKNLTKVALPATNLTVLSRLCVPCVTSIPVAIKSKPPLTSGTDVSASEAASVFVSGKIKTASQKLISKNVTVNNFFNVNFIIFLKM